MKKWASNLQAFWVLALTTAMSALGGGPAAAGAAAPQWLRFPAIAPNGKQIAFAFQGDLWIVGTHGGRARQLTTHAAYEGSPVWSPDSHTIVFASDRYGNFDLFAIAAAGGAATRLTFHSADDLPTAFLRNGRSVLFTSHRQDDPRAVIGHPSMGELYQVALDGGRPRQILTTPAEAAVPSPDGRLIAYHDYKGYEDHWRKHHVSPVARDVWIYDTKTHKHTKETTFRGEDRNPVWNADGTRLFWLSERKGTFNVWAMPLGNEKKAVQLTHHTINPVRFLTIASDGTLCYGYNGQIWVKPPKGKSRRVKVQVVADERNNPTELTKVTTGATQMAVSPNNDEIALVIRGEVFVTSVDYATTKRITNTPQQERTVTWAPDGRTLFYAAERNGSWDLYKSSITRAEEDRFASATLLTEQVVLQSAAENFQPAISPDGKKIAYLRNRDEIRMLDLETKKSSPLVPARLNYSYSDGDIHFQWSPDSKWLAFLYNAHHRYLQDIGIVEIATGRITNITDSGYSEDRPIWSRDGRALLFVSDRLGRRNHGGWGSDQDVFGFYVNRGAWEWATLTKEELARRKRREAEAKKKKNEPEEGRSKNKNASSGKADDGKNKSTDDKSKTKPARKPIRIDLTNREDRLRRLTLHSAPIAGYDLSPDGEVLVYFAQEDKGWDLWASRIRSRSTYKLAAFGGSAPGEVRFAKDGKSVFVMQESGTLSKVSVPENGTGSVKKIAYAAEMKLNRPAERAYLFEHVWRQVKRKFYRPDLHGVDWDAMKENYAAFLPSIANDRDFVDLLSEMLGELNASHTGARYRPHRSGGDSTADLGILFDLKYDGAGLRVAEVISRGPADREESRIKPGVIITHIDGVRLTAQMNVFPLLNHKAGKQVRLGLHNPKSKDDWEEIIKPVSSAQLGPLLYERWIRSRRVLVDKLSKGRVGYVHIKSMNDASFRRFYRDTLGRNSDKEALIVDTRYNGGGWLHDDLVAFLSGKDYVYFQPRGKKRGDLGAEPATRWSRPVVVVQSESNYSDAHMFPYAFKQLKLGKLVGTPIAGTGTAVWWETLINPAIVFGIPQIGMVTPDGKYLENLELEPDVLVYNPPESVARGEDRQIAKAVEVLLKQLGSAKKK